LDPTGEFFVDGWVDHSGIDIRRWDTLEVVESIVHADATTWGGPGSGAHHNRNGWAANSQNWICLHLGWDVQYGGMSPGANQVLYDWINHERIVVTENAFDSHAYDSAGDFWVGSLDEPPIVDAGANQVVALVAGADLVGTVQHDADVVTTWSQVAGPGPATFATPEQLTTHVDFDLLGAYTLRLTATAGELSTFDEVSITAAQNGAPSVDAGEDQIALVANPVLLEGVVEDDGLPNGNLILHWGQQAGPAAAAIATPEDQHTLVTFPQVGDYTLRLSASDGEHAVSDDVVVSIVVNQPPRVEAGESFKVTPGGAARLQGEVEDDGFPDATVLSSWSTVSGPGPAVFADVNDPTTQVTLNLAGEYLLRLTAHDGELSAFDDVVAISGENAAPDVNAGGDQSVVIGNSVLLLGEAEDDGLPSGSLTVSWLQISGAGTAIFGSPIDARTLVSFNVLGDHTLRLQASDGELTAHDDVVVMVVEPPSLELLAPNGGEVWTVGHTETIEWRAKGVDDVTLSLSTDGGTSWAILVPNVSSGDDGWGAYPVRAPDEPSAQCLVAIDAYLGDSNHVESGAPFTIVAAESLPSSGDPGCSAVGSRTWIWAGCALMPLFMLRKRS
ncbi:hypothetical protein ACFL6C_13820, partial [Myxococcota bacterium]